MSAAAITTGSYRRGALLVAAATLAWSSSGVIVRIVPADAWTTLFWRSVFACLVLTPIALRRHAPGLRRLGFTGCMIAVAFATSMACFLLALQRTSVAHVLVFQAAAPLFAAVLAWWLNDEPISAVMAGAIVMVVLGVAVMMRGTLGAGHWAGDALSAVMSLAFALVIVLAKVDPQVDMLAATTLATLLAALVAAPSAHYDLGIGTFALLALFGVLQMAAAMLLFTAGVRLIPAADAGLISVLETVLAPLWTWLAVGENPGTATLAGGAIVVAAIIAAGILDRGRYA